MLREVKNSGGGQIVVDCDYDMIRTVLKQAQAVGMMTHKYEYLVTSLVRFRTKHGTLMMYCRTCTALIWRILSTEEPTSRLLESSTQTIRRW